MTQPPHSSEPPIQRTVTTVSDGFERLAELVDQRVGGGEHLIAKILDMLAHSLNAGLVFLSKVEGSAAAGGGGWLAIEHVVDRTGMGLHAGDLIALADSYCTTMVTGALRSLVVPDALTSADFAARASTTTFGIGAYSGVPVMYSNGHTFGTLCALYPQAHQPVAGEISLLTLSSHVIIKMLETETTHQRRHQAIEAALRESEDRFRTAFHYAAISMGLVGPDGRFLTVNHALCLLTGYTEQELLRMTIDDLTHPADRDKSRELFLHPVAVRISDIISFEIRYLCKDHRQAWVQVQSLPVYGLDGELHYFITQIQDVTARKQAEQALLAEHQQLEISNRELARSNADLEQFAAVASHDLQEPLRMLVSYMRMLQQRYEGALDEDALELIAHSAKAATRLQDLIGDLLVYARLGAQAVDATPVDLNICLQQAISNLQSAIQESGAHLRCDPLPIVHGSASQLTQLFQNLIGNAIKFRRDLPPEIAISATRRETTYDITVEDNGIGIDPRYVERIFRIFHRLHSNEQYPGTGVGLAICKRVLEQHGGSIRVESTRGDGSTFICSLPLQHGAKP